MIQVLTIKDGICVAKSEEFILNNHMSKRPAVGWKVRTKKEATL